MILRICEKFIFNVHFLPRLIKGMDGGYIASRLFACSPIPCSASPIRYLPIPYSPIPCSPIPCSPIPCLPIPCLPIPCVAYLPNTATLHLAYSVFAYSVFAYSIFAYSSFAYFRIPVSLLRVCPSISVNSPLIRDNRSLISYRATYIQPYTASLNP